MDVKNIADTIVKSVKGTFLTHVEDKEIAIYVPSEDAMVMLPVEDGKIEITHARYMDQLCDGLLCMLTGMWQVSGCPTNDLVKYLLAQPYVTNADGYVQAA